jgi:hypothetical protein
MTKFEESITALHAASIQVVVIYPIPEIGHKVPETLAKLSLQRRDITEFGLLRTNFDERNTKVIDRLDTIVAGTGAFRIKPHDILCDPDLCRTYQDGKALYHDDDHLSSAGAALLGPEIDRVLATSTAQASNADAMVVQ